HAVDFVQQISVQSAGNRDVVVGMRESAAELLRHYAAAASGAPAPPGPPLPAGSLPEVLLVYRDGVADSMFDTVLAEEYTAIKQPARARHEAVTDRYRPVVPRGGLVSNGLWRLRNDPCVSNRPAACTDVGGAGYSPKVTFTVVQKSHNTRFFPTSAAETHRSGNVRPGTVVDQAVVDANAFDFFLNSHAGIQGTNRAPRYTVLVDEVGFTAESLQLLTFGLCHTYATCHRTLSLPPAARLGDRAADRARIAWRSHVATLTGRGGTKGQRGAFWYEMLAAPAAASYVV
ncbi:Protein argonaute 5, partial [Tetrabaena socialis]